MLLDLEENVQRKAVDDGHEKNETEEEKGSKRTSDISITDQNKMTAGVEIQEEVNNKSKQEMNDDTNPRGNGACKNQTIAPDLHQMCVCFGPAMLREFSIRHHPASCTGCFECCLCYITQDCAI